MFLVILQLILHLLIKALKNNCYDSRASNDQYLGNDLQNCPPSSGLFLFYDIESKCPRNSEKEEIGCEVVKFIMYMKQMMTLTVKLKLLIILPCLKFSPNMVAYTGIPTAWVPR